MCTLVIHTIFLYFIYKIEIWIYFCEMLFFLGGFFKWQIAIWKIKCLKSKTQIWYFVWVERGGQLLSQEEMWLVYDTCLFTWKGVGSFWAKMKCDWCMTLVYLRGKGWAAFEPRWNVIGVWHLFIYNIFLM